MTTARELKQRKQTTLPPRSRKRDWRLNTRLIDARERDVALSLRDVAAVVGIAVSHLHKIERGVSTPGVDTAIKLARFYETTVEELFGYLIENGRSDDE